MKCFSQCRATASGSIAYQKTPSWSKACITFYKLFIPSLSKEETKWLSSSLPTGGQRREGNKVHLPVSVRVKDTSTPLCHWCAVTAGGGTIPRPVPWEVSGSRPWGSIPLGRNLGEARNGSNRAVSGDGLGWSLPKLEKLKPLNAPVPLHRQSISGNTRCFNTKFPLGSILFPKAQPPLQHRLSQPLLPDQYFDFYPQSF